MEVHKVPFFCVQSSNILTTGTALGKLWTIGAPLTSIFETFGEIMHIYISLCNIKYVNI